MDTPRDLFQNIWTDITITRKVLDRNKVIEISTNIRKDEVEEEQRSLIRNQDEEVAESFTLDNTSFQAGIMRAIQGMLSTPVQVAGERSNEMRFLPPSAVKEVVVTVNNLRNVILA